MNRFDLIGRVGKDPVVTTKGGQTSAFFTLATSERWKNKETNEYEEKTEWHPITMWGPRAEHLPKFVFKGSLLHVTGEIRHRSTKNDDGTYTNYVNLVARDIDKLAKGKDEGGGGFAGGDSGSPDDDADIPF